MVTMKPDYEKLERHTAEAEIHHLNQTLEQHVDERTVEIKKQAERLRLLANKLCRVEQDERRHLASILHDHIQPHIVAARMQVWDIQRRNDPETLKEKTTKIETILAETLGYLRSLSVQLSPSALQNNGLAGGLKWLKSYMEETFGFTVHLSINTPIEPVQEETSYFLFECVRELLLNTVKHAGVDEATIFIKRTMENLISLVVSDQGRGFDPELIDESRQELGTLGLFSIQERLKSIGGRMLIETLPGHGTKIILTSPAGHSPSASDTLTQKRTEQGNPGNRHTGIKREKIGILIVDDHEVLREGLKGLLETVPEFQVLGEAANGKQALDLARKLSPDVVLMDVNLKEETGIQVTETLVSNLPDIRVIGFSIHTDQSVMSAMYRAGAVNYLSKDAPIDDIIAAIRDCLA